MYHLINAPIGFFDVFKDNLNNLFVSQFKVCALSKILVSLQFKKNDNRRMSILKDCYVTRKQHLQKAINGIFFPRPILRSYGSSV